jgi:hypothetical protein
MIVVFLVMITIMIVPTIGLPSVDAKERRSDRQAKRTNRTVSKQRLPGLSFAKSWRPTVLEFDVFVTIGFARFKKQQGRLNSVGLPNGLFENPRRRFAPLSSYRIMARSSASSKRGRCQSNDRLSRLT